MVEQIEYAETDPSLEPLRTEVDLYRPGHLQIEGSEAGKALCVARADEFPQFIGDRVRKPGMDVEHRHDRQPEWRLPLPPPEDPVRCVERQPALRIRIDYRIRIVSEELVEVVQIAECSRTDVGCVDGAAANLVLRGKLKLAVEAASLIRNREDAMSAWESRTKSRRRIPLLESRPNCKGASQLPVKLEVPSKAARVSETGWKGIDESLLIHHVARCAERVDRAVREHGKEATLSGTRS